MTWSCRSASKRETGFGFKRSVSFGHGYFAGVLICICFLFYNCVRIVASLIFFVVSEELAHSFQLKFHEAFASPHPDMLLKDRFTFYEI